jgi:valyl-tRNA synthetase
MYEEKLYSFWEKNGYFTAKVSNDRKPFSIILPPPNANGNLHLGHAMFVYEDVLIRYNKMMGKETLWLLGLDHAGIETQFVYEKHLKKQGKSRFDYSREDLFKNIWDFVMENKHIIKGQMRKLGFALDWSKEKFTMDEDIVKIVHKTFKDLYAEGLIYRANRLVNYCTNCGTSYSDLEVNDREVEGKLYYIKFPIKEGGEITIATTRPETYLGDVAVMVNPKDKRYKNLIGKTVVLPIINREIPVIADEYVDMKFGTGAVKVTPNHDFNDFEIAKKHKLDFPPVVGFNGKMQNTKILDGMWVKAAREEIVKQLTDGGFIEKITPHKMVLKVCYRCGMTLEPLPKEQWFISVKPLAKQAIELVSKDQINIQPKKFKKQLTAILDNFIDWNISRQIVWGIRIPAYECVTEHKWFVSTEKPEKCQICGTCKFVQDEDTFDTWFSSAQWPFATLQSIGKDYFDYFYPTTVMETGYDILRAWVARMIMVGYFKTKKVPFENVFLHGMVRDKQGVKMSKSKGNVIDPLVMIDKYGADSLRAALVFGTQEGGDVVLSEDKILGMRNFGNKIWNIGRFIKMNLTSSFSANGPSMSEESKDQLKNLEKEFSEVEKKYHLFFKKYQFAKAFDLTYDFLWHRFADVYIEALKEAMKNGNIDVSENLKKIYFGTLVMLHPYMPYVTEAVWQSFSGDNKSILDNRFEKN